MLARVRSFLLPTILLALFLAVCVAAVAQVNGVPASVTSFGFGGSSGPRGVPPSVTSLGPSHYSNSWPAIGNCCSNFFSPEVPNVGGFSGRRHHRKDRSDFSLGVIEPVYVPYAAPYAGETDDDPADEPDSYVDPRSADNPARHVRNFVEKDAGIAESQEAVAAQPSTVLIFKDGHHSDVLNYAIVGDTLFDFSAGRTRRILLANLDLPATQKANDDRGVDFQIPANAQ